MAGEAPDPIGSRLDSRPTGCACDTLASGWGHRTAAQNFELAGAFWRCGLGQRRYADVKKRELVTNSLPTHAAHHPATVPSAADSQPAGASVQPAVAAWSGCASTIPAG